MRSIACNRGKEPIVPVDVDTPADDELSSGQFFTFESLTGKGYSREHKGQIAQKAFATLPSVMPLVARPVGLGEKQAGGRTRQFKP